MRFYKNLGIKDRRHIILGAVAFSEAMEGSDAAFKNCMKELKKLNSKSKDIA
ncbi:hypothetical protein KAI54_02415 [Candidatus Gracilibacteria bacterium]|nr:hypothetical protein [Candidatus Gracilibacteria bacterium]